MTGKLVLDDKVARSAKKHKILDRVPDYLTFSATSYYNHRSPLTTPNPLCTYTQTNKHIPPPMALLKIL